MEEELTLRFPDGAKIVMKDVDAQELEQVSKARRQREVSHVPRLLMIKKVSGG